MNSFKFYSLLVIALAIMFSCQKENNNRIGQEDPTTFEEMKGHNFRIVYPVGIYPRDTCAHQNRFVLYIGDSVLIQRKDGYYCHANGVNGEYKNETYSLTSGDSTIYIYSTTGSAGRLKIKKWNNYYLVGDYSFWVFGHDAVNDTLQMID